MAKHFIIILTLFISLVSLGQVTDTFTISKKDLRQFFSDIRRSDLSTGQMLLINQPVKMKVEAMLFYAEHNPDIFQSFDTSLFVSQISFYNNYQWDTTIIDKTRIVSQTTVDSIFRNSKEGSGWEKFKSVYGKEELYSLSVPIFTKDKNYCIVEINRSCGSLCGTYCTLIFKRQENQWKLFKELECSVS